MFKAIENIFTISPTIHQHSPTLRALLYTANTEEMLEKCCQKCTDNDLAQHLPNLISQLLSLPQKETAKDTLLVIIPMWDVNMEGMIEKCWEVVLFKPQNGDLGHLDRDFLYSVIDVDWAELIDTPIAPISLVTIDFIDLVNAILEEITWHGIEYQEVRESQQAFIESIRAQIQEVEKHPESTHTYKTFDELREALGLPEESEEERKESEEYRRKLRECLALSEEEFSKYKKQHDALSDKS